MPKTLLVVDDSDTIREAARNALAGEDWSVAGAASSAEALEVVARSRPDAALCDVALGDENGYEVCQTLRKAGGDLPVILMGSRVSHAAAMAAGAAATLTKPFDSAELLDTLQSATGFGEFDLDFTLQSAGEDEPLRLGDPEPAADGDAGEEDAGAVEVIDLSGDDAFADLELLDDLEPIAPLPQKPPTAAAGAGPGWPGPTGAGGWDDELFSQLGLDLNPADPRAPAAAAPEASAPTPGVGRFDPEGELTDEDFAAGEFGDEPIPAPAPRLTGAESPAAEPEPEPEPGAWEGDALGDAEFALLADEPRGVPLDRTGELPEVPESYLDDVALGPDPSWDRTAPPAPAAQRDRVAPEDLGRAAAAAAEGAVRQALAASLTPEALGPVVAAAVERVVWEVVPRLAERLILEAIEKLQSEPPAA